ncbi:DUF6266 family protein [Pedobacter polysacchareus]|uniref:DUF6266 family protein n=1 Tax=Pedobacter polysacchareus TaxID=2861973 RepID=UPI001C99F1A0|nr:DUF6266 family protein [Pedobacter polysacchareus]
MAKFIAGPFGYPSGKIGNTVFYMLNGQLVCRRIGKPGKPSLKQLANRQAMAVTMQLLNPMADFINVSFKLEAEGTFKNPHNIATSYNKKEALKGSYPNISVDYAKVVLSKGSLEMAKHLHVSKGKDGINLTWDTAIVENGDIDDSVMVMVCHPGQKKASSYLNAGRRADGGCFLPLNRDWKMTEQMEIYICFKSANGKLISDSAYVGNLNGVKETIMQIAEKEKYNQVQARFDLIAVQYQQKKMDYAEGIVESKAFRHLEKEYLVLKDKLAKLPGKSA